MTYEIYTFCHCTLLRRLTVKLVTTFKGDKSSPFIPSFHVTHTKLSVYNYHRLIVPLCTYHRALVVCREDLEVVLGKIQEVRSLLREGEREMNGNQSCGKCGMNQSMLLILFIPQWLWGFDCKYNYNIYIYIYICMYESTTPISHIYKYMFSYYLFH